MGPARHIAVVGGGIVGSAIALELATHGAQVTLVDAGGERASESSFGWINASWFNRPDYFRLRHFSMEAWRRWQGRVSGLAPHWTGGLLWELVGEPLEAFVRDHGGMGYRVRMVESAEIRKIEPALARPPARAALAEAEGFIEAGVAGNTLRAAALAAGVRLVGAQVAAVGTGSLRLVDGDLVVADNIVVAAGAGTAALLGLPVETIPGLMVLTTPLRRAPVRVLIGPEIMLRSAPGGRVLCGGEAGGSRITADTRDVARGLLEQVKALTNRDDLGIERIIIGRRPTPVDEHPIIGPIADRPGVYAAVMHSGVTLAPGVAELVAGEVLEKTEAPLLEPFRPDRFKG